MEYDKHREYYEAAYKTGTDIWTHIPNKKQSLKLTERLSPNDLILDLGSGRGVFAKSLADSGFRVLGIDFEKNIVQKVNEHIKEWGLLGKLKFIEGDALDIPFSDTSFDGISDLGLFENLYQKDWERYVNEIDRVLKPGGFYLNISLSRKTKKIFDISPESLKDGELEKYGMHYHFFEKEEMQKIFGDKFNIISQEINITEEKHREVALLETLFQKK